MRSQETHTNPNVATKPAPRWARLLGRLGIGPAPVMETAYGQRLEASVRSHDKATERAQVAANFVYGRPGQVSPRERQNIVGTPEWTQANTSKDPSIIGKEGWQEYYDQLQRVPAAPVSGNERPQELAEQVPMTELGYFQQAHKAAIAKAVPPVIGGSQH